jgi:hypothetical protein
VAPLPLELRPRLEAFIRNCYLVGGVWGCLANSANTNATTPTKQHNHKTPKPNQPNPQQVFDDLDATLLEMNPFTLDPASGQPFPLDIRVELDDTSAFR